MKKREIRGADLDKLDMTYTFRISSGMKGALDKLTRADRADLNRRLLLEAAKKLHETAFDPKVYGIEDE